MTGSTDHARSFPSLALAVVLAASLLSPAGADGQPAPAPDFLEQYAATYRFRLGQPSAVAVAPDGRAVFFLRSGPRDFARDLFVFDVARGEERVLLRAADLLGGADEVLTVEERARRERMRLRAKGIADYRLSEDGKRLLVPLSGRLFVVDYAGDDAGPAAPRELALPGEGVPIDPRFSPDAGRVAFVRAGDLHVFDLATGEATRLTESVSDTVTNGLADFVAQEEMGRDRGFWWSPDGETIAYQRSDTAGVETLYLGDPAHPERPPQPWPYPRAGKQNVRVRLGLVPSRGGETRWVRWDSEAFPYLAVVRWQAGAPLTLLVQNREQSEEQLLAVDPETGETQILLAETDEAWLNIDPELPRWLPDGSAFLWSTERGGAWELELRSRDGALRYRLGARKVNYRGGLLDLDAEEGTVTVLGGTDPTEAMLYRLPLDPEGGAPERLTHARGEFGAVFEAGAGVYVELASLLDGTERATVRRRDGTSLGTLRSVAEEPPFRPRLELVQVGESPGPNAFVVRPREMAVGTRYPVIVHVYGGPHVRIARSIGRRYVLDQWIADHGFVVVGVDGRGTPARGRAWERAIHGDLLTQPLADQVAGLRALGARFADEMDLARVGIFGWSFGGTFAAYAVARRPDVFHAAVAVAPVVDWADYDTHYTERYLGLPETNPEGYARSSVLPWVGELARPLLLVHGTADDNVYFFHTLKLVAALFREGRPFDFLPLVGETHSVSDALVTKRLYTRLVEHFRRHLTR